MSPTHRPLSAWIAHIAPDAGEPGPVNDGDDRSDAREMDYFADGWHRVAVPLGADSSALGLTHSNGATVVELDDFGVPITISSLGLAVIDRVEQRWPLIDDVLADEFPVLGDESLPVRYWLLERLDVEGDPPDEVFRILPWNLLDRAVEQVSAGLKPDGEVGELVEIRHWLTPAVRGLTGPLEQLDHGLRSGDRRIARLGASALLANLRDISVSRIPDTSRERLNRLVNLLGILDPLYRHTSRIVAARLTGGPPVSRIRAVLNPSMEAAAGTETVRQHSEVLGDDDQWVRITKTRAGKVHLTAHVARVNTVDGLLTERLGAFLPVRLVPRDGRPELRFWIALYVEDDHLVGSIEVVLSQGDSRFDADDAPVGVDDLEFTDPTALLASLQASSPLSQQCWFDVAEELPSAHPVRVAVERYEDSL